MVASAAGEDEIVDCKGLARRKEREQLPDDDPAPMGEEDNARREVDEGRGGVRPTAGGGATLLQSGASLGSGEGGEGEEGDVQIVGIPVAAGGLSEGAAGAERRR